MKIYCNTPTEFVRLQIVRVGEDTQYLTLIETTIEDVEKELRLLITKQNLSPFAEGKKTSINIRRATGAINGKSKAISFRGISAKDTFNLIVNHINKL